MESMGEKKNVEFLESWMKSQKEFFESWTMNQKDFMEKWLEAAKKIQESCLQFDSGKAAVPAKEVLDMYSTWFSTMVNSSKTFTDEAMKMQETWKSSWEKQLMMGREMFKSFSGYARQEPMQQQHQ